MSSFQPQSLNYTKVEFVETDLVQLLSLQQGKWMITQSSRW